MRGYYDSRLGDRTIDKRERHGEENAKACARGPAGRARRGTGSVQTP